MAVAATRRVELYVCGAFVGGCLISPIIAGHVIMHVMLVVIPNSLEAQRAKCVSGGALKSPGLWSMMSAGAVGGQPPWPMPLSMLRLCVRYVVGSRTVAALTQGGARYDHDRCSHIGRMAIEAFVMFVVLPSPAPSSPAWGRGPLQFQATSKSHSLCCATEVAGRGARHLACIMGHPATALAQTTNLTCKWALCAWYIAAMAGRDGHRYHGAVVWPHTRNPAYWTDRNELVKACTTSSVLC